MNQYKCHNIFLYGPKQTLQIVGCYKHGFTTKLEQYSWAAYLTSKPNKERNNTGQFSDDDSNGSRTPRNFSRSSLDHGGGSGRTPREGYESSHNDQADHELTDASDYIDDNDVGSESESESDSDNETKVIGPAIGPQI